MDPILFLRFVFAGAIRAGAPVMYASLGETVTERAGIVNLGVEGSMLMGACIGFMTTAETGSAWLGFLVGGLAGAVVSLMHAYLVVHARANQLASGLVLLFFALGFTALVGRPYVSVQIGGFDVIAIPVLSEIPFFGPVLFRHDILTYIAYLLVPLIWWVMYRTRWGLALRAVGESRVVAFSTGRNPALIAYAAVFFSGLMAGFGGAQLSLAYTHFWVEGMTNGIGFIAVALVIFGMWHPARVMLGVLLFGGATSLQLQLQTLEIGISPFLLQMLPYLLTLSVLLLWGQASKRAMPAELGVTFSRNG
ncbi:MAG: ABC transporter permease [Anaerolineaceae bacterium]|nr:ABC transporter permease [Anaerolineaceae bacterium]